MAADNPMSGGVEATDLPFARTKAHFDDLWEDGDLEAKTLTLAATQTLAPRTSVLRRDRQRVALPRLIAPPDGQLVVHEEIAAGGMGVVRSATQVALHRRVAVKQLREDRRSEQSSDELVCEAWLIGSLEHPNIVPVYMLGRDEDGYPAIVMKKIDGQPWAHLLRDPDAADGPPPDDDPLRWHVEILMQVCNAVAFAHDRGVIHRDLKPDNVMVGRFGEVYVLDWGIATSLSRDEEGRLPMALDSSDVAGTPGYMAPEMVVGDGELLTERSDVYLLGAVLHEIVTGQVRHRGGSMYEVMLSVYMSEPYDYGSDVPRELARICNRAMHVDPDKRYETVEAFRVELADFLRHRESRKLADEAAETLDELRTLLDADGSPDPVEAYRLFGAARFGFEAARSAWSNNPDAKRGFDDATRLMLEFELAQGDARAARRLLGELEAEDTELAGRVSELEQQMEERAEEMQELRALRDDLDIEQASGWRGLILALVAIDMGLAPFLYEALGEPHHLWFVAIGAACWGAAALGIWWLRDYFLTTAVNRRVAAALGICAVGAISVHILLHFAGVDFRIGPALDALIFAAVTASVVLFVDRRLIPVPFIFFAGAVVATLFPKWALWSLGISSAVGCGYTAWVWWRGHHECVFSGSLRGVMGSSD